MCLKEIAFDLDDTLLNNQKEIISVTRKVFSKISGTAIFRTELV